MAAIYGFDANDGHDHFGGYAVTLFGHLQDRGILRPESQAALNACLVQEARPVPLPGAHAWRAGRADQTDDARFVASTAEAVE
ncbi:hypothetical protein SDC9_179258 [bioreactor metagenome]|uniref:Uncharacterized protein n=1 Tax=bioreactor metagenome TaxID=1076179 RepID=A0A645H7J6_9ZZZZ